MTARTQEIGVRMALGARVGQVVWLVLREGFVQLTAGLALGIAGAYVLTRVLQAVLVSVSPGDPATLASAGVLLSATALAACIVPALRAARLDPLAALRVE